MKRLLSVLAGTACLVVSSSGAIAAGSARVSLLTAPFGTSSYVLGAALQDISNKTKAPVRIDSSESPGYVFNIKKLASDADARKSTMVGSGKGLLSLAAEGGKPFDKKYKPLKLIGNYNLVSVWLATLNPKIKTIQDLAGKHIGLGRATQINWTIQPQKIIQAGYGMGSDKIHISYLGTKESVSALLDGHVDAAVVGGYMNPFTHKFVLSPQTTQFMASGRKVYFIPWDKDAVEKTVKKTGVAMIPLTLPANTIDGQSEALPVFADTNGWFVSEDFPKKEAYEITKMIIQNVGKFASYHALGKLMSKKALVVGFSEQQISPGALKAYREAGILK
ncbi:MAG TPA: TAXI family TRAP transporter solute-binding subunit [Burkholderiales bacterium]|nr:TAXI family TRAP transporter solute-binding subunit [Burkholderiales bacterium]